MTSVCGLLIVSRVNRVVMAGPEYNDDAALFFAAAILFPYVTGAGIFLLYRLWVHYFRLPAFPKVFRAFCCLWLVAPLASCAKLTPGPAVFGVQGIDAHQEAVISREKAKRRSLRKLLTTGFVVNLVLTLLSLYALSNLMAALAKQSAVAEYDPFSVCHADACRARVDFV